MSPSSQWPNNPAYYIEDCQISDEMDEQQNLYQDCFTQKFAVLIKKGEYFFRNYFTPLYQNFALVYRMTVSNEQGVATTQIANQIRNSISHFLFK